MKREIKDAYDLRAAYYAKHPNGHFFDRETLKWFGERFSEMRLLKGTVQVTDSLGKEHTCYVLSSLQRIPMVGRKRVYHYFDVETLEDICWK